jgi:hypothetical protein
MLREAAVSPAQRQETLTMRLGFLERVLAPRKPPAVGEVAVVKTLALPAVRLAVKPKLAVDLSAVLMEGPHVLAGFRLLWRRGRPVRFVPVLVGHL